VLKVRVIPTLLWKKFGLVKGIKFDSGRRVGPVLPAIKIYNSRDVDELILLDVCASSDGVAPDFESIEDFSEECFIPFSVGGGITSIEYARRVLRSGADKISINTAAFTNPKLIEEIANSFGSQSIIASIDARRSGENHWTCYSRSGVTNERVDVITWSKVVESMGAGEILITSIDCDGLMQGYDLDLISAVVNSVNIPVIASGGAGCYQDLIDAVVVSGASAVAAASMFHFTEQTPLEAKRVMQQSGIPVRENHLIQ
jgi:imidazole glycerol-phosphate synthase subunit HisF